MIDRVAEWLRHSTHVSRGLYSPRFYGYLQHLFSYITWPVLFPGGSGCPRGFPRLKKNKGVRFPPGTFFLLCVSAFAMYLCWIYLFILFRYIYTILKLFSSLVLTIRALLCLVGTRWRCADPTNVTHYELMQQRGHNFTVQILSADPVKYEIPTKCESKFVCLCYAFSRKMLSLSSWNRVHLFLEVLKVTY